MSLIRGHGNKTTELALIRVFRTLQITGWRRKYPIFGKPDFVFPKLRVTVFVDGCFWHKCPLHSSRPKQNTEFWETKLNRNRSRDHQVNRTLKATGWLVVRIWEHELTKKNQNRLKRRLQRVFSADPKSGQTSG